MDLLNPNLNKVFHYITYYEMIKLTLVNKLFYLKMKEEVIPFCIKPPDGRFAWDLVRINSRLENELPLDVASIPCNGRFTCADGCQVVHIKKLSIENPTLDEEYAEEDAIFTVSLEILAKKDSEGINWTANDPNVTVNVTGLFNMTFNDDMYTYMNSMLKNSFEQRRLSIPAYFFLQQISFDVLQRIVSKTNENNGKVTVDSICEIIPFVLQGELGEHLIRNAIYKVGKHKAQIPPFLSHCPAGVLINEIEQEPRVFNFLNYILHYLGRGVHMKLREITVDHLLHVITHEENLRNSILLDKLEVERFRVKKLLKGRIIKEKGDNGQILIETESFPLRFDILDYAELSERYDSYQNDFSSNLEGVMFVDNIINEQLRASLMENIDKLARNQKFIDYHPGSKNMVRDYVHPGLYSYVHEVSQFVPSPDLPQNPNNDHQGDKKRNKDLWGRQYETSRFQWLPTYLDFHNGSWHFRNEINNLPKEGNEALYHDLEELFSYSVPYLEQVIGYGKALGGEDERRFVSRRTPNTYDIPPLSLKTSHVKPYHLDTGSCLQVICKIVDYEIQPNATYEGVWHVEGMSHENIIATIDYIIDRDESLKGGELQLKRAFLQGEARILLHTGQGRSKSVSQFIQQGFSPIGKVETKSGRMILFPNSHVHKILPMTNLGTTVAKRRIIVFFVINPDVRIISTQEISPQSQMKIISHNDALMYRLELMKERKFIEQDWNVRTISLCEH